jgi:23S rRNA (adenine1618-N6)-methyltransferase
VKPSEKTFLHPRNPHRLAYDFPRLTKVCPDLAAFVRPGPNGQSTIDFGDPAALKSLNRALLVTYYGLVWWDIPAGSLCPPIPGRADYIHHVADLLAEGRPGGPPHGPQVLVLDIGVGANCIYPLIGRHEYGWRFVGSDCNAQALAAARRIVEATPGLDQAIELRLQPDRLAIFAGVMGPEERFDLSLCNPPFHPSAQAARQANGRRRAKQGLDGRPGPALNFGGQADELWCPGGELAFIRRMIAESAQHGRQCRWFTSLVSSRDSLPGIHAQLKNSRVAESRIIPLATGQKASRIVAWRFA